VTVTIPDSDHRWRCGHCGNLTRFDVTRSTTATEYWHFTMAGDPVVETTEVAAETIERVVCRWCGASDRIEIVPRPGDADEDPTEAGLGGTP
jgi:transcription elongation factor Elf1